jgi:hypothetical protein
MHKPPSSFQTLHQPCLRTGPGKCCDLLLALTVKTKRCSQNRISSCRLMWLFILSNEEIRGTGDLMTGRVRNKSGFSQLWLSSSPNPNKMQEQYNLVTVIATSHGSSTWNACVGWLSQQGCGVVDLSVIYRRPFLRPGTGTRHGRTKAERRV